MSRRLPSGRDEDGEPIDDAVDFDVRYRQWRIRKRKASGAWMRSTGDKINASLQSYRDGLRWVDERGDPIE